MSDVKKCIVMACLVIGCGGGESPAEPDADVGDPDATVIDSGTDSSPLVFAVTSPGFVEGAAIPATHTCDDADTSPQLDWVNPPAGAMSFAFVLALTDVTPPTIHCVFYDVPSTLAQLPADVEKSFSPNNVPGAHTTKNIIVGNNFGYAGPCPPAGSGPRPYSFTIHALDVATLPGTGTNTSLAEAKVLIDQHEIAAAVLAGTYER